MSLSSEQTQLRVNQFSEIAKTIGLIASGLWVAWTFHKLQKVRAAKLDNDKRIADTAKAIAEGREIDTRTLSQQPQLSIKLNIADKDYAEGRFTKIVCVSVTLANNGMQNLRVLFDKSALMVSSVTYGQDKSQSIGPAKRFSPFYFASSSKIPQQLKFRIMRVGQTRQTVLALIPIAGPTCFILQFQAVYVKEPFDGEGQAIGSGLPINAIEQEYYVSKGATS